MIPHDLDGAPGKAGGMCEPLCSINLEIIETQDHLRGHLTKDNGPSLEFEGWLGLLSVLGGLLDHARAAAHPQRDQIPKHRAED